jgi:uncharacterized protein YndB with AHSA1/START domain
MVEKQAEKYVLKLTRVLNAPRQLVFDVWTDPKHFGQWWGPKGFTLHVSRMDVRAACFWAASDRPTARSCGASSSTGK